MAYVIRGLKIWGSNMRYQSVNYMRHHRVKGMRDQDMRDQGSMT